MDLIDNSSNNTIWYASYGSNISQERFECYLKGGSPKGSNKTYRGCKDKSSAIQIENIIINYELYFARESKTWENRGVGFIRPISDSKVKTLGRMYLITKDQFIDIVKQETNHSSDLEIDFSKAKINGNLVFKPKSWYGKLIYLGEKNEKSIFTFTSEKDLSLKENEPALSYLNMITNGLKEAFDLTEQEIGDYLSSKKGIIGKAIEKQIKVGITDGGKSKSE